MDLKCISNRFAIFFASDMCSEACAYIITIFTALHPFLREWRMSVPTDPKPTSRNGFCFWPTWWILRNTLCEWWWGEVLLCTYILVHPHPTKHCKTQALGCKTVVLWDRFPIRRDVCPWMLPSNTFLTRLQVAYVRNQGASVLLNMQECLKSQVPQSSKIRWGDRLTRTNIHCMGLVILWHVQLPLIHKTAILFSWFLDNLCIYRCAFSNFHCASPRHDFLFSGDLGKACPAPSGRPCFGSCADAVVAWTDWYYHRCPRWCWPRDCHACWCLVHYILQKNAFLSTPRSTFYRCDWIFPYSIHET